MKTNPLVNLISLPAIVGRRNPFAPQRASIPSREKPALPKIMVMSTFPPRACGIATYSEDLIKALEAQFQGSFDICRTALETDTEQHRYPKTKAPFYVLNTDRAEGFVQLAKEINRNDTLVAVLLQYEFGLFAKSGPWLQRFLESLNKPVAIVFHTVLPNPDAERLAKVAAMAKVAQSLIVMTQSSAAILESDYGVPADKISVIPHGTHLIPHNDKDTLKAKHHWQGRTILSTFGLISPGKGIELSLEALPEIIRRHPEVLFLVIGKTHPGVVREEGERYRHRLEAQVAALKLENHVEFIDAYLPLSQLLDYLQLTDIYLFTSTDPFQAVSGTLSYAISCGCPVVSTPIPHALELIGSDAGIIIDFGDREQLTDVVCRLLETDELRTQLSSNGIERMASTAWENSALAHASLLARMSSKVVLHYRRPPIRLDHLRRMTTERGMVQFAVYNQPDLRSGFTLDDNARALIVACEHFSLTEDPDDLPLIQTYLDFIAHCQNEDGSFLNYLGELGGFSPQNSLENLEDANGRAIWALGYMVFSGTHLPEEWVEKADRLLVAALPCARRMYSTRAMAFSIKGLYYRNTRGITFENVALVHELASRLLQMYRHESDSEWKWFEGYMTYANGLLPEAMLCAYLTTSELKFRDTAKEAMTFLLERTFEGDQVCVIRNQTWLHRADPMQPVQRQPAVGAEQPIDVAYLILSLFRFYETFHEENYLHQMQCAFDWFLGRNHLRQVIYNPSTGGCYDGLEENNVNLNQGAESTLSYLLARLTIERVHPATRATLHQFPYAASDGRASERIG
jgi:glycosyltransferase involved in cell wall biosynthesis